MSDSVKAPLYERVQWIGKAVRYSAVACILLTIFSGIGHAAGLWPYQVALLAFAVAGALSVLLIILGVFATMIASKTGDQKQVWLTGILTALCAAIGFNFLSYLGAAGAVPQIHDITTDLEDIPQYSSLAPDNPNPDDWLALHRAGYPDLEPIRLDMDAASALERAATLAAEFGWRNIAVDETAGIMEATDKSAWFGFADDIVVRVRADGGGGVRVDMRSVSRVGISDIGVNAKRIEKFLTALQKGRGE